MTTIQPNRRGGLPPSEGRAPAPEQLDLVTLLCGPASVAERFRDFLEKHPHIYRILVDRTREYLRSTGRRRVGIALIWEVMRYDVTIQTGEAPKLDNNLKAHFARLIMLREPDLADVFETRKSRADDNLGVAA